MHTLQLFTAAAFSLALMSRDVHKHPRDIAQCVIDSVLDRAQCKGCSSCMHHFARFAHDSPNIVRLPSCCFALLVVFTRMRVEVDRRFESREFEHSDTTCGHTCQLCWRVVSTLQESTFMDAICAAESKLLLLVYMLPQEPPAILETLTATLQQHGISQLQCWPAGLSSVYGCNAAYTFAGLSRPQQYPLHFMLEYLRHWCALSAAMLCRMRLLLTSLHMHGHSDHDSPQTRLSQCIHRADARTTIVQQHVL